MLSDKDIVTKNELTSICERLGQHPSDRKRIIIARADNTSGGMQAVSASQFKQSSNFNELESEMDHRSRIGSMDKSALDKMNSTHHFNYDSKMSIQAGEVKKHDKSMFTHSPGDMPLFKNQNNV